MNDIQKATVIVRVNSPAQLDAAKRHVEAALRGDKRSVGAVVTAEGEALATYRNRIWSAA